VKNIQPVYKVIQNKIHIILSFTINCLSQRNVDKYGVCLHSEILFNFFGVQKFFLEIWHNCAKELTGNIG
jgi:hypothetical protein